MNPIDELKAKMNDIINEWEKLKAETEEQMNKSRFSGIKSSLSFISDFVDYWKNYRADRKSKKELPEFEIETEEGINYDMYRDTLKIYAPAPFVRYYRRKFSKNREKYAELEKYLRGCRFPITVPKFLAVAAFYPLLLAPLYFFIGFVLGTVLYDKLLSLHISFRIPHIQTARSIGVHLGGMYFAFHMPSMESLMFQLTSAIVFTIVMFFVIRYLILTYPKMYASHRRGQIEVVFPHVVNMMLGMAKGGIPITEMFEIIADEISVTGEVGKEFRIIVNRVKLFHENVLSAIRYVSSTTPSQKFADFLDDMINVIEGSGRLSEFLEFKSQHLMDEREKYQELFLNSLGILAEVYVSALVVAPLFLLIIFVVMGMIQGGRTLELMKLVIYMYMPFGGLMFIWMLWSMTAEHEVKWTGEKVRKSRLAARVSKNGRSPDFVYPSKFKKMYYELVRRVKMIIGDLGTFVYKPEYSFYLTVPAFLLTLPFIYKWKPETLFVAFLAVTITPYAILVEIRNRRIRKIEEHIPDFLKQLASLNESGMNVVSAIRMLSTSNLGALTSEIVMIRKDLEWGMLLSDALKRFEKRISSMTVTKVTSILLRSMEAAGTIKDALFTAANDAQLYLDLKNRVKSEMFVYIVVIYMTFGVFLFTIYILTKNFVQVFSKMHVPAMASTSYVQFRVPNIKEMTQLFYHTSLINGTVSGLIAGLMGEGEVRAGLKHVLVLVAITFLVFTFLIGY